MPPVWREAAQAGAFEIRELGHLIPNRCFNLFPSCKRYLNIEKMQGADAFYCAKKS
jgi:hypothetical protein